MIKTITKKEYIEVNINELKLRKVNLIKKIVKIKNTLKTINEKIQRKTDEIERLDHGNSGIRLLR